MIVEGNSTDPNGISYEVRVTMTDRLITHDTSSDRTVPLRAGCESTGCREDIFTDTISIKHNMVFNPYTAGTQVDTYCSDKQEDKTQTSRSRESVLVQA